MERRKKEERRGEETQYGTQRDKELVLGHDLFLQFLFLPSQFIQFVSEKGKKMHPYVKPYCL